MSSAERVRLDADEYIWRRVHKTHLLDNVTVSSAAFNDEELSVDRRQVVEEMGHGVEYTRQDGAGVAELQVAVVEEVAAEFKAADLVAVENPLVAGVNGALVDNPAHALVLGKKPKRIQRALRRGSSLIT